VASMWFYKRDGKLMIGPFTSEKLKEMAATGQILPTDTVRRDGAGMMMVAARRVKGLFPLQTV
jgi:hypothetical protein